MVYPTVDLDQQKAYAATLRSPYEKRIRAQILNRAGDAVAGGNITPGLRDGNMRLDASAPVSRLTTLEVLDPKHRLGFDADTYNNGILDLTRMVRVWWVVNGPLLRRPISVAIHTGPFVQLERTGALASIEAQGKEVFGLGENRRTIKLNGGMKKTDAIRRLLRQGMGETRMVIPDLPGKMPEDVVVSPKDRIWPEVKSIVRSMNRYPYFDGWGTFRMPKPAGRPEWSFVAGPGGNIVSPLTTTADLTKVINHVVVTGVQHKGKKHPVSGQATADRKHHLSPWRLGPPDAPIWHTRVEENKHLRTDKECEEYAEELLKDGLKLIHDVGCDVAPVPHLDPMMLLSVNDPYSSITSRLRVLEMPLGGGPASIGQRHRYAIRKR